MDSINSKIILNVEINNIDLISKLNILSQEMSRPLDDLILYSIEKLLFDIEFIRKVRN